MQQEKLPFPLHQLPAGWIDKASPTPHLPAMGSETPDTQTKAKTVPVFAVSCWALGMMAFSQIIVAGLAMATRLEDSKVIRTVVKEEVKLVTVRIPAAPAEEPNTTVISKPPTVLPDPTTSPLPAPSPIAAPGVDDPRSERLVKEARQARIAGDMGLAIVKLQDAQIQSQDDPTIHFELGLVHEQMGVFDIAGAHYQKVYDMGITKAGALYQAAARKLHDGFKQESKLGKISLSQVRFYRDPEHETGEQVILTIPIEKAPGEEISPDDVGVGMIFFNKNAQGDIVARTDDDLSTVQDEWLNAPCDWADGTETMRATYTIPKRDVASQHLFGQLGYYGYVIILRYGGEVVDVQARPSHLAAKIPQEAIGNGADKMNPGYDDLPFPDIDLGGGLLPPSN